MASVKSGVVEINANMCDGTNVEGTGFLIAPNMVATADHVVDQTTSISLQRDGATLGTGTVIGSDTTRDLALVRTTVPISGHVFTLANRAPELGESVAAIGFPLGLPLTVTRGSISGTSRAVPIEGVTRSGLVQTDAAVNPGNSGGPLLSTTTGEVLGVVDAAATGGINGIGFAIAAQDAAPELTAWRQSPQTTTWTCGGQTPAPQPSPASSPTPVPTPTPTPTPPPDPSTFGAPVTGTDNSGYNTGQGCSDNPSSPLPGCADSPSVPSGDQEASCPGGITVDSSTTSCVLAENVVSSYTSDGTLTVSDPAQGQVYEFNCFTGGTGTTGYTFCLGQAGSSGLYLRWHQ